MVLCSLWGNIQVPPTSASLTSIQSCDKHRRDRSLYCGNLGNFSLQIWFLSINYTSRQDTPGYTCNSSARNSETGGCGIQSQLELQREFQMNLGCYVRPCLKQTSKIGSSSFTDQPREWGELTKLKYRGNCLIHSKQPSLLHHTSGS